MIRTILAEQPTLPVAPLCEAFGVNRAWYYARLAAPAQTEADIALRDAIERIVLSCPGYGYRRVTAELHRQGYRVNHKRVLRIMHAEALLCQLKRHFVVTTDSRHDLATYPNLLAAAPLTGPNQAFVADITYIRLPQQFVYLAAILDAYSRYCVGWHLSATIDTQLTLQALEMALTRRSVAAGWIHHSDRGVQYAATAYIERLRRADARISMSAKGNPYDNAKAESFFKTLKVEEVYLNDYRSLHEAEANIGPFIEDVYNTKRLHSSLGYLPPAEFEMACADTEALT
jgi:putative transposase